MAEPLESERVLLREWRESDVEPWVALNLDAENLKFFPRVYSAEESLASYMRIRDLLNENSFGLWAAQEKSSGEFMGFVGLMHHNIPGISFMPCYEIGWRLDKKYWGKGYATEAAKVVLAFGLKDLQLEKIYSFTAKGNIPSINVMKKIGLQERPELAFEHPRIPDESPVKSHVVYST
jgi:RimJ/RimL family protein N-acetyltransferase